MLERSDSETSSTLGSVTYEPPPAPFDVRIRLCAASSAQRLAHGRPADAEVASASTASFGSRSPGWSSPCDDALAEPLGDQLVLP